MPLIINGKPAAIPDADKVHDAIAFKPGTNKNTRKQTEPWHGLGIHWTGGERGADAIRDVLLDRKLSIHFCCEPSGRLVQLADLTTRCAHIGSPGNGRFIGVETSCRGFASKEDWEAAAKIDPTLRVRDDLDWATPRDTYADMIDGYRARFAGFNLEQVRSLIWLAETTAGIFQFPRQVPARKMTLDQIKRIDWPVPNPEAFVVEFNGALWMPAFDRDPGEGPTSRAATWRGALGHFHVHPNKMDPGTQVMYALWSEGWNPANKKLPDATPL
jgi:hypothetical protein